MTNTKPFLILQLRPEDDVANNEFEAFLKFGDLEESETHRIRMEKESIASVNLEDYSGVIVGGGPSNASDTDEKKTPEQKRFEPELLRLLADVDRKDFPYLGACYGLGILVTYLQGVVSKERYSESVGAVTVELTPEGQADPLTQDLARQFRAFVGHKEAVQDVPPGAVLLARGTVCPVQMIRYKQNIYATQFHPELDAEGLTLRVTIYKHAGYFPPADAAALIAAAQREHMTEPERLLKRFVARYRRPA